MDMPHVIHLSVEGHLGCLLFLAVINYAALNVCIYVFGGYMVSFLRGKYLGVELLGHMVTLRFTFLRNYQPVFQTGSTFLHPP